MDYRFVLVFWILTCGYLAAQEFPGVAAGSAEAGAQDPSGRSVKTPRIRIQHALNADYPGASAWLLRRDPWLGYQFGWDLFRREFAESDGVFGPTSTAPQPVLEDRRTRMVVGARAASCALCHNTPFGDGGAGATISKNGASGRNTQHLFGAGLIEMLGQQLRLKLHGLADKDRNGFISKTEAVGRRALIENVPASVEGEKHSIDFGCFDDRNGDGKPDLNPVCFIWYVDASGHRLARATSLHDAGVEGYSFEVQVFGWGHGTEDARTPISSTLRGFSAAAFHVHAGLQANDATLNNEARHDGLTGVSLSGAQQFFTAKTLDRARTHGASGESLDDPDRDGHVEELSRGDMDVLEHYLLNHPQPSEEIFTPERERGRTNLTAFGCTACHVPDWHLEASNSQAKDWTLAFAGDRRFFALDVSQQNSGELQGNIRSLSGKKAWTIRGVYSDFAYHDLGPAFHQLQYTGTQVRYFRTAPLWGVGSTAPYGHDGASLTLDAVIRRHGGEALESRQKYEASSREDREALLALLRGLVLYSVRDLQCDIDGKSGIEENFVVAGRNTGRERFNPEWLFDIPGRIVGDTVRSDGNALRSYALENTSTAYGLLLRFLKDADGDGFPDERLRE